MINNSKNNLLTWLVILLIAANVVAIGLFLSGRNRPPEERGTPGHFLVHELGLNTDQQTKLKTLADKHHEASQKIRGEIKDARDHFFELIKQPNVDDSTKNKASAVVAAKLQELELLTFDHFRQVRLICTPEQQKKFDEVLNEVIRMIGGPPPGPPPGGPRGGRDHPGNGPGGDEPGGERDGKDSGHVPPPPPH